MSDTKIGSRSTPFRLHLPADWYRENGEQVGLSFSKDAIVRAKYGDMRLGLKTYTPSSMPETDLEIPRNAYVECFVVRRGIHDPYYHRAKNLGKPEEKEDRPGEIDRTPQVVVETGRRPRIQLSRDIVKNRLPRQAAASS